jgi:hypothetical protein
MIITTTIDAMTTVAMIITKITPTTDVTTAATTNAVTAVSVQKVVPTLTSKSAEICLSMAGAKRLVTRGLSWFRPGPYVQQWCPRGTILCCTVVLAEGSYKHGGREAGPLGPRGLIVAECQYCGEGSERVSVLSVAPPAARGLPPLFIGQGEAVHNHATLFFDSDSHASDTSMGPCRWAVSVCVVFCEFVCVIWERKWVFPQLFRGPLGLSPTVAPEPLR